MSNFLFAFIISGAVAHVSWNVFLKKTEHKIAFTRGFTLMGSVLLLPTLFFMGPINPKAIPYFIGSIIIHVFYKIYLCRVYDHSNLSYGYPIARGLPSLLILFLTPIVFGTELTIKNEMAIIVLCHRRRSKISFIKFGKSIIKVRIICGRFNGIIKK